jgi:hypothetical protein
MGYILFMFTPRARVRASACERAHASARVVETYTYFLTDSLQIWWAHTTNDHKLHGLHTFHVHTPRARAQARVCERASAWLTIRLSMDGFSSNFLWTYYTSQQVARETCISFPSTACTRSSACVRSHVIKAFAHLSTDSPKMSWDIQQIPRGYMSYLLCVWMHVLTARTSIHSRICQARDGQWLV